MYPSLSQKYMFRRFSHLMVVPQRGHLTSAKKASLGSLVTERIHTILVLLIFLFCQEYARSLEMAPNPQAAHRFFLM